MSLNLFPEISDIARGWASGSPAIAQPTAADIAASEALDHSSVAYGLSKRAHASGKDEDHKQAARMLEMAGDSHEKAAKLYRGEGNLRRAEEEETAANARMDTAQRHKKSVGHDIRVPVSPGGASTGTDFLAEAKAIAARENISIDRAASIVSARRPDLFNEYRSKWNAPSLQRDPRTLRHGDFASAQAGGSALTRRNQEDRPTPSAASQHGGDFAAEAKALSAREKIPLEDACSAICRAKPALYSQYRRRVWNYR